MSDFVVMMKKKMVEKGRDDFTNYTAEILGISKQVASQRLNGRTQFSYDELAKLNVALDFDANELKNVLE